MTIISCNSIEKEKNHFANANSPLELTLFDSLIIFSKREIISNINNGQFPKFKSFYHSGIDFGHDGARLSIRFSLSEIDKYKSDHIEVKFWDDEYLKRNMTSQTKKITFDKYKFRRISYFSGNDLTKYYLRNALMLGWKIDNEISKNTDYNIIYKLVSKDSSEYISNFNLIFKTFELTYNNPKLK